MRIHDAINLALAVVLLPIAYAIIIGGIIAEAVLKARQ